MNVAVVTAWIDHRELADDYFAALELGPTPAEAIVVDNGSATALAFAAIRNDRNEGFSRASNQGLHAATAEIVAFVNNDVWASARGWLEQLCDEVAPGRLVGAKIRRDAHGTVDGQPLPYLDGWCLAGMRDDLLDLGGFDETLEEPSYYSDNLLCLEARARGMTLREVPCGLNHKGQATAGRTDAANAVSYRNYLRFTARARELLVAA